jgi:predicted  nucleic acid-binding Zn-ribbon protein
VSSDAKPEFEALAELEDVLHQLTGELSSWRRRAQRAEAALGGDRDIVGARERASVLEAENRQLAARLGGARARLADLLKRLQFLEEQAAVEEQAR